MTPKKWGALLRKLRNLPPAKQELLVLGLALGFAWLLQAAVVVKKFQGHPTGLFHIGEMFHARGPGEILAFKPFLFTEANGLGSSGYDGQFFYYLAHDPFLRNGIEGFLDVPKLRARRIGYPLLGWIFSLGNPWLAPAALYLVNMAALLGCVALLGRRARRAGLPYAMGLLFVPCASTSMTLYVMTCEIVATFFLFLAMTCFEKKRTLPMLAATLMALLTKEVCLMWAAALILHSLAAFIRHSFEARRLKLLTGCLLVVVLWGGWVDYVRSRLERPVPPPALETLRENQAPAPAPVADSVSLPEAPAPAEPRNKISIIRHRLGYFTWPLTGAVEHFKHRARGQIHPDRRIGFHIGEIGVMLTLLAMAIRGVARFRLQSLDDPAAILFAVAGLVALCMKADIWWWSGNYARQLFILLAVALWFLPRGLAARGDLYGHAAFSLWKLIARFLPFTA